MSTTTATAQSPTWKYKPPSGADLVLDTRITLGSEAPGQSVYVVQWQYRGKTVNFALTQQLEPSAGKYAHIARYDCCHSEVHKHQYHKGSKQETRTVVAPISDPKTAWETVDAAYETCYDQMFDGWHENYRKWV